MEQAEYLIGKPDKYQPRFDKYNLLLLYAES